MEGHRELEKVHKLSSWKAQKETKERRGLRIGSHGQDVFRTTANKLKMEDQQWRWLQRRCGVKAGSLRLTDTMVIGFNAKTQDT